MGRGQRKIDAFHCEGGKVNSRLAVVVLGALVIFLVAAGFFMLPDLFSDGGIWGDSDGKDTGDRESEVVIDDPAVSVADYGIEAGEFYPGDIISAMVMFVNEKDDGSVFWAGCSVRDPVGRWFDLPATEFFLESGEVATADFSWDVPNEKLVSGSYLMTMALWSGLPGAEGAERLATVTREDSFEVFNCYDDFSVFNEDIWDKSDHPLGAGELRSENVGIRDGRLELTLPANTLDGGQIETIESNHLYGSFRTSMKLAYAPSSITGFFLYAPPDFYHEVDIEVFNDSSGDIWFTTYADGIESNSYKANLGFDPTADFYEYRFDFYPEGISFYVDGKLMASFDERLTDEPMQLMINSWFPVWLDNLVPEEDAVTLVEWIKY